jgi:hypothetical protein
MFIWYGSDNEKGFVLNGGEDSGVSEGSVITSLISPSGEHTRTWVPRFEEVEDDEVEVGKDEVFNTDNG